MKARLANSSAFPCCLFAVLFALVLPTQLDSQAPANIHTYADAAACQMGAREGHYLPGGITPDPVADRVPMFWDRYGLIWLRDPKGNGKGEYMLTGTPPTPKSKDCSKAPCEIEKDFPEKGANGPYKDPYDSDPTLPNHLRCDHFPYVAASCTPDQLVKELYQGTCGRNSDAKVCQASTLDGLKCADGSACVDIVRWRVLMRRSAASAKDGCAMGEWAPHCTEFYPTVDADGLRIQGEEEASGPGTFGVAWLDSVGCGAPGCGSGARDFDNGFRNGQKMPRAGGRRPALRPEGLRAAKWYDDTKNISALPGNSCNNCHGTPFNGNDWIRQKGGGIPRSNPADDRRPWWFAGNDIPALAPLFPTKKIFKDSDVSCDGCHRRWMEGAGSTPGGASLAVNKFPFVRWMNMVHEAVGADLNENPFDKPGFRGYFPLASSFRIDKPETTYLKKNARQTHYMPPRHRQDTIQDWNKAYSDLYNSVACCGGGFGKAPGRMGQDCGRGVMGLPECPSDVDILAGGKLECSKLTCTDLIDQKQVVSLFQTPWMWTNNVAPQILADGDVPNPTQMIGAPDPPEGGSVKKEELAKCPAGIGGDTDKCFRLTWNDPPLGEEFNAPQSFHYKQKDDPIKPKLKPPNFDYCTDSSLEPCPCGDPENFNISGKNDFPNLKETPITDPCDPTMEKDCWRYKYETVVKVPKCTQKWLHICGGWCSQAIKLKDEAARSIVSTEKGQLLSMANTIGLPQGQLNLGDGHTNFHFNGTGGDQITVLVPSQYCNGGVCQMAQGNASGSGDLQSSGSYTVSSPSNAPFFLTANPDGSFTATQGAEIDFSYNSPQGTLTGTIQLSSATGGYGYALIVGSFTATGGTFAQYFPAGGSLFVTLGLTGGLDILVGHQGFLAAEFTNGTQVPVPACIKDTDNAASVGIGKTSGSSRAAATTN